MSLHKLHLPLQPSPLCWLTEVCLGRDSQCNLYIQNFVNLTWLCTFQAYLASESEDSEPDAAAQAKYKALLSGGDGADSRKGGKGWGGGGGRDDESASEVRRCACSRLQQQFAADQLLTGCRVASRHRPGSYLCMADAVICSATVWTSWSYHR